MKILFAGTANVLLAGLLTILSNTSAIAESPIVFDDFFLDKALRLEMYQTGDAKDEVVTLHQIAEEPIWPESPRMLIPPFEYGRYAIRVFDAASDEQIFETQFDTMFAEFRTTTSALAGTKRVFETTVRFPCPKKPVRVSFQRRNKQNVLSEIFTTTIDPSDYHILRESPHQNEDWTFEIQKTGDPHERVDLAFLSEGYMAADKDKFKADVQRMTDFLFTVEPYKSAKGKFNVYGVFRPSAERGVDEPRQHIYKSTVLNASYNAFDLDRYLLTESNHALHRMAARVPYDTVIVLVNTARYGGGSICLDYCIASVDHTTSPRILVHEFGHSFAYLADEYVGTVAYNDRYPPGVEPLEVNITELLDPKNIKWKALLTPELPLPTSDGKAADRALQTELNAAEKNAAAEMSAAKSKNATDEEIKTLEERSNAKKQELETKLSAAKEYVANLAGNVGAFEGAGYLAKGMYRPQIGCWMGGAGPSDGFCVVCRQGIKQMIDYYAPELPSYTPLPIANDDGTESPSQPIHVEAIPDSLRSEYRLNPFYKKCTVLNGIPIIGSENVSDFAFLECAYTLDHLLHGRTMAHDALVKSKVRVGIIAATEYTMDIPENQNPRMLADGAYHDRRSRGLGGLPLTTCAEENLLNLRGDHYNRENITIHEFSHTVVSAIRRENREWYARLRKAYDEAILRGDYGTSYAATNEQEYWAEGAQCWFDCANARNAGGASNRKELKEKDSALAALLTEVYGDGDWRYVKTTNRQESEVAHLAGIDRSKMPAFNLANSPRIQAETKRKTDAEAESNKSKESTTPAGPPAGAK